MRISATYPIFLAITFFIIANHSVAQNLVPNPGFEEYKRLPYTFSNTCKEFEKTVEKWTMPNAATSDYFNTKSGGKVNANKNFAGVQKPQEGQAYAGFILYQGPYANYREYLEVKLNSKLKAGKKYVIQFYISLAEQSEFAIDRIGILIQRKEEHDDKSMEVLTDIPTVETADSLFFDDEKKWTCIRESFIATGGEKYLIIGNFRRTKEMHLKSVPLNKKKYVKGHETYYFIDNVCLSEEKEDGTSSCLCSPSDTAVISDSLKKDNSPIAKIIKNDSSGILQTNILENSPTVFSSVFFDTDKWDLKPSSFPALDSLADFLDENPKCKIEIDGHTDNSGDEAKNQKLSERRAEALAKYLISAGIAEDRITWKGYGSSRPLIGNETPEGRAKNRRVEYLIKK